MRQDEQRVSADDGDIYVFPLTISLFSALAPGAYRQVTAPRTQRCGAEKLHEYSGESGAER